MALRPELILAGAQKGLEKVKPVTNFLQGAQAQQAIAGEQQRQNILSQQAQQQAVLAPLQQQALAQDLATGEIQQQILLRELEALGVPDVPTAKELAFNAAKLSALPTPEAKLAEIGRMKAAAGNRSTQNLDELEQAYLQSPESGDQLLAAGVQAFERSGLLSSDEKNAAVSAGQREFESLIEDFSPEEQQRARRIKAGLAPRATGSAAITAATTEGLTEQVAESEATIKQRTKFAELTGSSRAKVIDDSFDRIGKIDSNIGNIDRAITAIDDGASTGAIESRFFPTFRRATKELEQVQRELGLDVIGSTTFGALSEGELQLALETALPTGLEPSALKEFLVNKKAAQQKLRAYYSDQINFLDQGGTIAGFLRQQDRQSSQPKVIKFDAQGNIIP